jgi:tyrosyl-DNA phosphodiesterase 2
MMGTCNDLKNKKVGSLLENVESLKNVPTYKYDNSTNKWCTIEVTQTVNPYITDKISFISYNVWFESHNWNNRINELLNLFKKYSPDFICFQEMTYEFLKFLCEQNFIQENYFLSGNYKGSYDVFMLSKLPVKFYVNEFVSQMGRNLLIANAQFLTKEKTIENLLIATSHFESLNNAPIRNKQLKSAFDILNISNLAFLMGDFNFDSSWKEEEKNIDVNFIDSWYVYKEKNNLDHSDGYTMAGDKYFPPWRPDRILFKDSLNTFVLDKFEIIGKEPIQINNSQRYKDIKTPSDHYGLYAVFSIN